MLINLRNALMTGKRWTNPYVTDGLVAMWDGQWNAGGGVHDPTATTWKDLTGHGYDLSVDLSQATWMDDHLLVTGTTCTRAEGLSDILTADVIYRDGYTRSYPNNTGSYFTFGYRKGPYAGWYEHLLGGDQYGTTALSSNDFPLNRRSARHLNTYIYSLGAVYQNAKSYSLYKPPARAAFGTGIEAKVISPSTGIEITAIRLYSRALTAAEIAANYAIDKERFNLP